jgi:hypothetical protein
MDRRQTIESVKGRQIYEEIKNLEHPFLKTFTIFEADTQNVAENLRKFVDADFITVTVKNTTIYVGTRQSRKETELRKMIRKLSLHVDDERLYEEAMTLLRVEA